MFRILRIAGEKEFGLGVGQDGGILKHLVDDDPRAAKDHRDQRPSAGKAFTDPDVPGDDGGIARCGTDQERPGDPTLFAIDGNDDQIQNVEDRAGDARKGQSKEDKRFHHAPSIYAVNRWPEKIHKNEELRY